MAGKTCRACGETSKVSRGRVKAHPCGPGRLCNGAGLPPLTRSAFRALQAARQASREARAADPRHAMPSAAQRARMRAVGVSATGGDRPPCPLPAILGVHLDPLGPPLPPALLPHA